MMNKMRCLLAVLLCLVLVLAAGCSSKKSGESETTEGTQAGTSAPESTGENAGGESTPADTTGSEDVDATIDDQGEGDPFDSMTESGEDEDLASTNPEGELTGDQDKTSGGKDPVVDIVVDVEVPDESDDTDDNGNTGDTTPTETAPDVDSGSEEPTGATEEDDFVVNFGDLLG